MARQARSDSLVVILDRATASAAEMPPGIETVEVRTRYAATDAAAAGRGRPLRDLLAMSRATARARLDVMYFPATYTYFPVFRVPEVITVHDAIAERFPDQVVPTKGDRLRWTAKQRVALHRARAVVTVSRAAADQIHETLRVDTARVHVISEAADECFSPGTADHRILDESGLEPQRYMLYVGGASPHKNLPVLLRAFESSLAMMGPAHADVRLVLVGDFTTDPFHSGADDLQRLIAASPVSEQVVLTGYAPDHVVAALYRGARATVLTSLSEGFGLPAVESIACGTPVVASDIPAFREVLDGCGLFAPAHDAHAFAAHMRDLYVDDDLWRRQAADSIVRSRGFDWSTSADQVLSLLRVVGQ